MLDKIETLIRENDTCVLATASENRPHTSLMAYAPSPNCHRLFMASSRSTKKYGNIMRNPQISVLIDSRVQDFPQNRVHARALTITGTCAPLPLGPERDAALAALVRRHPHMAKFLEHPDCDLLQVDCESWLYLDGVSESYFERVQKN